MAEKGVPFALIIIMLIIAGMVTESGGVSRKFRLCVLAGRRNDDEEGEE